jgi:ABC-type Zn2+ transport system substrate-binding protein/surface adhesin
MPPGGTEIDIDLTLGDGFGIGLATGEAALATLRLGQDALDFFDQRVAFDLEFDRGKTECGAEHNGAERHDGDSEQNIHYWYLSRPAKPMKARAIKPAVTIAMADAAEINRHVGALNPLANAGEKNQYQREANALPAPKSSDSTKL